MKNKMKNGAKNKEGGALPKDDQMEEEQ